MLSTLSPFKSNLLTPCITPLQHTLRTPPQAIANLHLDISAHTIKRAILSAGSASTGSIKSPILRSLKPHHIQVWGTTGSRLHILPPDIKVPLYPRHQP